MKRTHILPLLALAVLPLQAQNLSDSTLLQVPSQIHMLQEQQTALQAQIKNLTSTLQAQANVLASQQKDLATQAQTLAALQTSVSSVSDSVEQTNRNLQTTDSQVSLNQQKLSQRTLAVGIAGGVLLLGLVAIVLLFMRRTRTNRTAFETLQKAQQTLQTAQKQLQEESVQVDNKLLEVAEKQLALQNSQPKAAEIDHSLALKVADEVVRIELNLSRMDPETRGYKQLNKACQRIRDNFAANGYEIVEMLGKDYDEGMRVVANLCIDENLEVGKRIITGITKPQVLYNGEIIQVAQITVSQNI